MDRERQRSVEQVGELYDKYYALVERRCRRLLGTYEAARDAAQEVFVRVLKRYDSFRADSSQVTWLYRISTNVCIDEIRRRARKDCVELTPEMESALAGELPCAERRAGSREALARLVRHMDPECLQICIYYHVDEMSQEEIATAMGLSRKTVWSRLHQLQQRRENVA